MLIKDQTAKAYEARYKTLEVKRPHFAPKILWKSLGRLAILITAFLTATRIAAGAIAYSTTGEATVYLEAPFQQPFVIELEASMDARLKNRGSSYVALELLGGPPPSDGITLGIFPGTGSVRAFTYVHHGRTHAGRDLAIKCVPSCRLSLRGDTYFLYADVNGREVARWSRFEFHMPDPGMQLNGEVDTAGDRISATMRPLRMVVGGRRVKPVCSFTTRGIAAYRSSGSRLFFTGRYDAAEVSIYRSLDEGRTGESCGDLR